MGLKYITRAQILEVIYESQKRQFSITSISPLRSTTKEPVDDLAQGLNSISISSNQELWTVGWDASIIITGNEAEDQVHISHKVPFVLFNIMNL